MYLHTAQRIRKNRTCVNYRTIYKQYYGPIPKDSLGRTFEIHHIDGNSNNNDPTNLIALSMEDHYNLHYSQGDYDACYLMRGKMKLDPAQIADLASKQQRAKVENGTHHFLGGKIAKKAAEDAVNKGTHPWLGGDQSRENNKKMLSDGTHPWLGSSSNKNRLANGTHPSLIKISCVHCKKTATTANFEKWHGENCIKVKPRPALPRSPCPHCGVLVTANILGRDHKNGKCLKN